MKLKETIKKQGHKPKLAALTVLGLMTLVLISADSKPKDLDLRNGPPRTLHDQHFSRTQRRTQHLPQPPTHYE